jgi:hypothetical protein
MATMLIEGNANDLTNDVALLLLSSFPNVRSENA